MSTQLSRPLACMLLGAAFLGAGCDDSLKSVSLIEETRVLGARVEVVNDPERSSPLPGESANVHLFVAAPNGAPHLGYALSVCAVSPTNTGFPSCAGAPFAATLQAEPSAATPKLDFEVPPELDLTATPHGFAQAWVCPDSAARVDSDGAASCAEGPGTEVAFEFNLGAPDESNRSPTFAVDALTFDGLAWPAFDAAQADCPGAAPEVSASSRHTLAVTLSDDDFEPLVQATSADPSRETLLLSQFSNAGKLSHAFLSLSADTSPGDRQLSWDAPAASGAQPELVRFYFVVRDARGGEDFTTRAVCVVP